MDDNKYNSLIKKLDTHIEMLTSFSPKVPSPVGYPHSTGFLLSKDTDISKLPVNQVQLAHAMLHTFYQNNNGKGLSKKTIESLHNDVVSMLKAHKKFDRLDKNG